MQVKQVYFYIFPVAFLYCVNSCGCYIIEQVQFYNGDKHAERHRVVAIDN